MDPKGGDESKFNEDRRWRLVNRTMRMHGNEPHALIETLHAVQEHFGFLDLDPAQQSQLLTELEPPMDDPTVVTVALAPGAGGDLPFFLKLKELTVLGYYTSEVGATSELLYRPVPGAYDGDALFSDSNRQWII